jgi:putative DNA primase/helicase
MAIYMEFKNNEKYASKLADISEFHEAFQDAGYVLTDEDLIIDIDTLKKDSIRNMVRIFDIKSQIVWTNRGAHLYFKKPSSFKGATGLCAFGFNVEYKHVKNTKAITIKQNGKMRDIDNEGVREPLPDFFKPVRGESLLGLDDGDGRNQKLHAWKFKINSLENVKQVLRFINTDVFAKSLDEEEFQTVTREEEILAEKDGEAEVAKQLVRKLRVVKYNGVLYTYDGTRYKADSEFKTLIAEQLEGQKTRYIDEVMKQMEYRLFNVKEPENGFDIKFKNGILRNGQFIEVDSTDFTPYFINVEYNPDAEPVEMVDTYLDQLTEGDEDYQKLVLEAMAHAFITNAEFKRQLAKFFVFIGDGGNGKGTLLTIIRKILGAENCSSLSPEEMTKESYFTSMANKLVNLGDDIEDKAINEKQMKVLKNVSTCDFVAMRRLFEQSKETVVTTSLIFTSNHLLKSFEKGESYKRRVIWCPMFSKPVKKDPRFITKLTTPEALEYWLKLIVEAYMRLYDKTEFTDSTKVTDYNEKYHEENNGTLIFVRDHAPEDFVGKRPPEVYEEYVIWAEENFGEGTAQSKKILKETIQSEMGLMVGAKMVNGRTAKVYMKK